MFERVLVLPCLFAILVSGSPGIYQDDLVRSLRHASCPSCRRERPDALVSWYSEPVREYRALEPEAPWSNFQLDAPMYPYERALRSRGGPPFRLRSPGKREDPFSLEGDVNFDLAPTPAAPVRGLEGPREYQPRYQYPRPMPRPSYLKPSFYNKISRDTDLGSGRYDRYDGFRSVYEEPRKPYEVRSQSYPLVERPLVQPQPYPVHMGRRIQSQSYPGQGAGYRMDSQVHMERPVQPQPYSVNMERPVQPEAYSIHMERPVQPQPYSVNMERPVQSQPYSVNMERPVQSQTYPRRPVINIRTPAPEEFLSREQPRDVYPPQIKDSYNFTPESVYKMQSAKDSNNGWEVKREKAEREARIEEYESQQRGKMAEEMRQGNGGRQNNGQFDSGDQEDMKGKRGANENTNVEVLGRSKVSWNRLAKPTEVSSPEMAEAVTERVEDAKAVIVP
ncbi:uncharacterized protein LOC143266061 [Megachile rotundata]|uniref:uncharacterized protein LOC143266061 n=1 Tax=Megachile rotundata TaxID=143995 RepID=UPI003FD219CA